MRLRSVLVALGLVNLIAGAVFACGARSDLPVPEGVREEDSPDAGPDVAEDVLPDGVEDVPEDAPPECGPDTKYIYLVSSERDLYAYNPANNAFRQRGSLDCPNPNGASPFSMGVDLRGIAHVVYDDGNLYRVSVKDASCEATDYAPLQQGFRVFGMGFALDQENGSDDTLFVAEVNFAAPSRGLATIDTETLTLEYIGPFSENPSNLLEMTSSNDGKLYAYFLSQAGQGGWIVEIDKRDATLLSSTFLSVGDGSSALAFAFYNDDFYIFTSPGGTTTVTRYRPADGSVSVVARLDRTVVGAGVAPCDPDLVPPDEGP